MLRLLVKSLRGRRVRSWLAVAGVASCTLLVIVIASAYRSVRTAISVYTGQKTVDFWVAPPGADNLIRGSFASLVPQADVDSIRALPGVAIADPILKVYLGVSSPASRTAAKYATLLTIGYRIPDGLGGPPAYVKGGAPHGRAEVALDQAAAFRLGVGVGDTVEIGPRRVTISGLTTGTNILATQFIFADIEAVAEGTSAMGKASFILVKLAPTADRERVIQGIEEKFQNLRVYRREYFVRSNEREVTAGFVPLLALVTILGVGAGALLVGLLILSVVDERRSDIAVLMALGAGMGSVGRGILAQASLLSLKGTLIGTGLAYGLQVALKSNLPTIPLRISPLDVVPIALLFILTGLGAAIAPVIRLDTVDPLESFRS